MVKPAHVAEDFTHMSTFLLFNVSIVVFFVRFRVSELDFIIMAVFE
jgi:hypothetical protein